MNTNEIRDYLQNPEKPDLRYFAFQVAAELSDLAAVLLYDIYNRTNSRKKPLIRNGLNWVYDPLSVFAADHPYASESGVRKAFLALAAAGFIRIERTGRYNKKKYDGKWWYALTEKGKIRAARWRMRFLPDVAISTDNTKVDAVLGIPSAVILENFRRKWHELSDAECVKINPTELKIPYSSKTIGRHLDGLVANGILERQAEDQDCYHVPDDWEEANEPLTVPTSKLLPKVAAGVVGVITAPSGTAKTSLGTFMAIQHALAGSKVVYITLEEPQINIIDRMYAQEFGVSYSALHRGDTAAEREVEAAMKAGSQRVATTAKNLKIIDLHGEYPTPAKVLEKIAELQQKAFAPDVVLIDQLEFSAAGNGNAPAEASAPPDDPSAEYAGIDLPLALALSESFRGQPFKTWVLHQVDGNPRPDFAVQEIAGGKEVADCFDVVLGIGRTDDAETRNCKTLRVFSLTPSVEFETVFQVDFPHMRFKPIKK